MHTFILTFANLGQRKVYKETGYQPYRLTHSGSSLGSLTYRLGQVVEFRSLRPISPTVALVALGVRSFFGLLRGLERGWFMLPTTAKLHCRSNSYYRRYREDSV